MTSAKPNMHRMGADGVRPVILVTPDLVETEQGRTEHQYALRTNYAEAIVEAGGHALIVPLDGRQLKAMVELADGVVVSGSGAGADVALERIMFERSLIAEVLRAGKPILGICHGMQLIGEHLGGQVLRDLPELAGEATLHLPKIVPDMLAHEIDVTPGTMIAEWSGGGEVEVNSLHRHALIGAGRFRVSARAADGLIEAIEGLGEGFCVGVQWHPEYRLTPFDRKILQAFVAACQRTGAKRAAGRQPVAPAMVEED